MKHIKKNLENSTEYSEMLLKFFESKSNHSFSIKDLYKKFEISDTESKFILKQILDNLVETKKIDLLERGNYILAQSCKYILGTVDHVNPKYAYIIPQTEKCSDIHVSAHSLMGAFDKDLVKVAILNSDSKRPSGKVVEIIKRAKETYVCLIGAEGKNFYGIPIGRHMYYNIELPLASLKDIKVGYKVIVSLVGWNKERSQPIGEIKSVLGMAGVHDVEMHAIMAEFELPCEFSEEIEAEANAINVDIRPSDIIGRRDFRGIPTFTIDPKDAKDFDDALSFRILPNGNYEIGVHIADVSFYVKEGTSLDEEALKRGCSIYLVDRTIPMLPEKLSNILCSLRPNEDKLTFSSVFEIDKNGVIHNEWFGETIICSNRRFIYEEAQHIMDSNSGDYVKELHVINNLAKIFREKRVENGAIEFEQTEVMFELDASGKPLNIVPKKICDTHRLVEEYMVLANNRVAEYVVKTKGERSGLVFRVHAEPDLEKLNDFYLFVGQFGYIPKSDKNSDTCHTINTIIKNVHNKPEEFIIQTLAIRTMAKALYTFKEQEHFGLGLDHYAHFTSPIRRYPDIIVHRVLKNILEKKSYNTDFSALDQECKHLSQKEQLAANAERASIRYKQLEYMNTLKDKNHEGVIAGITEWGMYVELTGTKCEGMVRISELRDDYYIFDKQKLCITGRKTRKQYKIGQLVTVSIENCDFVNRTVSMKLI